MADEALKEGWEEAPGGMVKNSAGQLFYKNAPEYVNYQAPQQKIDNGPVGTAVPPAGQQTPGSVATDSYMKMAQQGTTIDRNDPNVKQQTDPYAAAVTRAQRDYETNAAERLSTQGLGNSGAMENERRMGAERAGQAIGSFESQVVGNELKNRRAEIQQALSALAGMADTDKKLALQKELAQLDAQMKQLGITTGADTAAKELALKDKLGVMGINADVYRSLLQNQQFNNNLGFQIGDREAYWNNQALQNLF